MSLFDDPSWHRNLTFALTAGVATLGLVAVFKTLTTPLPTKRSIPSPTTTLLPHLTNSEIDALPYPPHALPGGRDLSTPYGSMRVYEFGPTSGRKVLLIHGITTPSISLRDIARGLARAGCRVTLFDLWGRGYSSTPLLPHDIRLYTTQILFALTASSTAPPPSERPNRHLIIGYSLGGAIAASFAARCPHLVSGLVLLAPGGLIRKKHFDRTSRFLYSSGLIPERVVQYFVLRRLRKGAPNISAPATAETAEMPTPDESWSGNEKVSRDAGPVDAPATVKWQVAHHEGFLYAFISSIRHAPITGYEADWREIGERLNRVRVRRGDEYDDEGEEQHEQGLVGDKVLIILGENDTIIVRDEVMEDATAALGRANVHIEVLEGAGHEFPITRSEDVVDLVTEFWGLEEGSGSGPGGLM